MLQKRQRKLEKESEIRAAKKSKTTERTGGILILSATPVVLYKLTSAGKFP